MADASDIGNLCMEAGARPMGERDTEDPDKEDPSKSTHRWSDRWVNCKFLARWALDGVVASADTEESASASPDTPSAVIAVTVAGPTLTRNDDSSFPSHEIDTRIRALDDVFVGVCAYEERGSKPERKVLFYRYNFILFSTRQLTYASTVLNRPMEAESYVKRGANLPTADDFARLVHVWRLGRVLDTHAGHTTSRCVFLNVVVEDVDIESLRMEHNPTIGTFWEQTWDKNESLGSLITRTRATNDALGALLKATYGTLLPAYGADLVEEVSQWEMINKQHERDKQIANLKFPTGDPRRNPPLPRLRTAMDANRFSRLETFSLRVYNPPSQALRDFYSAYLLTNPKVKEDMFQEDQRDFTILARAAAVSVDASAVATLSAEQAAIVAAAKVNHAYAAALRPYLLLGKRLVPFNSRF
jgi:hypothetical protein